MNYHMIRTDDMLNGDGLRVVVFLSGCSHYCMHCHNPETWDENGGKPFDINAFDEIANELKKGYISGITLSGGDPLFHSNLDDVYNLLTLIKDNYPNKTIWLYTGYQWDYIMLDEKRKSIAELCDYICDGEFVEELADVNYPWAGSTNQRVINVQKTLATDKVVLYNN